MSEIVDKKLEVFDSIGVDEAEPGEWYVSDCGGYLLSLQWLDGPNRVWLEYDRLTGMMFADESNHDFPSVRLPAIKELVQWTLGAPVVEILAETVRCDECGRPIGPGGCVSCAMVL